MSTELTSSYQGLSPALIRDIVYLVTLILYEFEFWIPRTRRGVVKESRFIKGIRTISTPCHNIPHATLLVLILGGRRITQNQTHVDFR